MRKMKKQQTTAPTIFISREIGRQGLRTLKMVATIMKPMLKYLKLSSVTLPKDSSSSLVLPTSSTHGRKNTRLMRQLTVTKRTVQSERQQSMKVFSQSLLEIAKVPSTDDVSQRMKARRYVMLRSLMLFPCYLFCFMNVITMVCREKARMQVPACPADPKENHSMSSRVTFPSAADTMNWMMTKRPQMKMEEEPYSLSFTSRVIFLRKATAKRGTKSKRESHWALNWLKTKLSFFAIDEAEPEMSTIRQMMEQNWSTIRSTVMMLSRIRQRPVMKRKMSSHFLPRILRMVHSMSSSSSEECRTQMRHVMKEMTAEMRRTIVPLMTPESLKMRGRLRIAGPSMLLNMARMVEMDEFFGQNPDMIKLMIINPSRLLPQNLIGNACPNYSRCYIYKFYRRYLLALKEQTEMTETRPILVTCRQLVAYYPSHFHAVSQKPSAVPIRLYICYNSHRIILTAKQSRRSVRKPDLGQHIILELLPH